MFYPYLRKLLFCLSPESAHRLTLSVLSQLPRWCVQQLPSVPTRCMSLLFDNPVMLAAGFDKNGDYVDALLQLGFGGIEVGTVTPQPQPGNPKPRCFRVVESEALINRMGFNNKGVDYLAQQLSQRQQPGVVGVNIGKNKMTPQSRALDDYQYCLTRVAPVADYVTINVSSPNTPGLRDLQEIQVLHELCQTLHKQRRQLELQYNKSLPLALKVCVDIDLEHARSIVACALEHQIDAIIMSNTTVDHESVLGYRYGREQGGVSGSPLTVKACQYLSAMSQEAQGQLSLIGVGGIMTVADAAQRLTSGANLIQLYTGLIYSGPSLLSKIVRSL